LIHRMDCQFIRESTNRNIESFSKLNYRVIVNFSCGINGMFRIYLMFQG
jgi:hypothetical protein